MAKKNSLLEKAKNQPRTGRMNNWFDGLSPEEVEEIKDLMESFRKGELSENFASAAALADWIVSNTKVRATNKVIARIITAGHS